MVLGGGGVVLGLHGTWTWCLHGHGHGHLPLPALLAALGWLRVVVLMVGEKTAVLWDS